jgi:hypothetical protein
VVGIIDAVGDTVGDTVGKVRRRHGDVVFDLDSHGQRFGREKM